MKRFGLEWEIDYPPEVIHDPYQAPTLFDSPVAMGMKKIEPAPLGMGFSINGRSQIGIERVTLYRYVDPKGELRDYEKRVTGLA